MAASVLLVDDHELIREGLRRAFERTDDFAVVAEAGSVSEAIAAARDHHPDVVVVDVRLPDGSGLDVARTLREGDGNVGIVVLTMYAGDEQLFGALEAGASAFVSKDAPAHDVVSAARHALVSPRSFSANDLAGAMQRRLEPSMPTLTQREDEILRLLADGLGIGAISSRLFISESTTKNHISKLYEKLGAANRAQALVAAMRLGLLNAPDN